MASGIGSGQPYPIASTNKLDYLILHTWPYRDQEKAWRSFLSRADLPEHYVTPEYFLEPWWKGKKPFAVLALNGGEVVGVLTGTHQGNHVECGLPSRPQICFERKTDPAAVLDVLARGLLAEAGPANLISLYSWLPLSRFEHYGFRIRQLQGNVVLDLTQGPDKLMKQFHLERRRHIRFAIRRGLEVSQACVPNDLEECYQLYCRWRQTPRKRIRGEQIPFSTFEQAWHLSGNRRAFLVRLNGKIIAADVVRFCSGGLLEAAGNFSADEFLRLRPNDLVIWRIIEWACHEGFTRFSLGGAHLFLRHFGGALLPIYRHRLDRTWLHRYNVREAIVDVGRRLWRKAPLPVETAIRRLVTKPGFPK